MTFIDQILIEAEQKERVQVLAMNKLRADQILQTLAVLEDEAQEVDSIVEAEMKILEEYRASERQKIERKAEWLESKLEQFIRSTDQKTINLPHGSLKLRLGREKVEVTDKTAYLPFAQRKGLLRHIDPSDEIDLLKLHNYIKQAGHIPTGVTVIPASTKFSYSTLKGNNNGNGKELSSES